MTAALVICLCFLLAGGGIALGLLIKWPTQDRWAADSPLDREWRHAAAAVDGAFAESRRAMRRLAGGCDWQEW